MRSIFIFSLLLVALVSMASADYYPFQISPATPLATNSPQTNTMGLTAHQLIGSHAVADYILDSGHTLNTSGWKNYTTADFRHRGPNYPDYLTFTTANSSGGAIYVSGYGIVGNLITDEHIVMSGTSVASAEIYKNVTNIGFYELTGANNTIEVGIAKAGPIVATDNYILTAGETTNTTSFKNYTTFTHQPDYARGIYLTPSKSTNGTAYVEGKDLAGTNISESLTWDSSAAANSTTYAFKTVSKIAFLNFTSGTTFKAGVTALLGLNTKLSMNTVQATYLDGTIEASPATTVSSTALGLNTMTLGAGTLALTKPVDVYYVVN